jgi:flavin reductase (DIM6/NTAB) family NADH-FMN oxidoreductase RutF
MGDLTGLAGLMTELDYPMVVVTTSAGDERSGCLVGFFSQCSVHPPRLAVFLSVTNRTFGVAERASHLAVHVLHADQRELAELFGTTTGDETDKFDRCGWSPGPGGVPVLDDSPSWVVGRVIDRRSTGDHVLHVLEPVAAEHRRQPLDQLGFQAVLDLDPGHAP